MIPTIKELVDNNEVSFDNYRNGFFYYNILFKSRDRIHIYQFPVLIDDIGSATLLNKDKAILFMRWIRKAINDKTLIEVKQ